MTRRTILVLATLAGGGVDRPTLEALTLARQLGEPLVVLPGAAADRTVAALGRHGAREVRVISCPRLFDTLVTAKAALLAEQHRVSAAEVVLLPRSAEGNEVAALVAAASGAALVTDVTGARFADDGLEVTKEAWAGQFTVSARVAAASAVLTVRPHRIVAAPVDAPDEPTVSFGMFDYQPGSREARVTEARPPTASARPGLADAKVVVAGGAGTGGDFAVVEQLADALGGAVAASGAAVEAGWIGRAHLVGQFGADVAPDLYVAAGISGASEHLAGLRAAKRIVAINSDPDAPIFQVADLGIVGDLATVLSATVRQLRG